MKTARLMLLILVTVTCRLQAQELDFDKSGDRINHFALFLGSDPRTFLSLNAEKILQIKNNNFVTARLGVAHRPNVPFLSTSFNLWQIPVSISYLRSAKNLKHHFEIGAGYYFHNGKSNYTDSQNLSVITDETNHVFHGFVGYRYQNLNKSGFFVKAGLKIPVFVNSAHEQEGTKEIYRGSIFKNNLSEGMPPEIGIGWTFRRNKADK